MRPAKAGLPRIAPFEQCDAKLDLHDSDNREVKVGLIDAAGPCFHGCIDLAAAPLAQLGQGVRVE
jgi:hypothetical protein